MKGKKLFILISSVMIFLVVLLGVGKFSGDRNETQRKLSVQHQKELLRHYWNIYHEYEERFHDAKGFFNDNEDELWAIKNDIDDTLIEMPDNLNLMSVRKSMQELARKCSKELP